MSRVDINILNTNEMHCLPRCIDAVLHQTHSDIRITVIDNASTDGSPEWVRHHHPSIRVIKNPSNLYYCEGHNVGIRQSDADFILLLNADVFIMPDFLQHALDGLTRDPSLGGVQGKLWKIQSASSETPPPRNRWIDTTGIYMTRSRRNFDRYQEAFDEGQFDEPGDVFGPDGSAPLYRREMLEDIRIDQDYFDADFKIYRDVVDLSWRARSRGWLFRYIPSATGFHVRGFSPRTRKKMPLFFRKLSFQNRYLTLIKNDTLPCAIRDIHKMIGFDLAMTGHMIMHELDLFRTWQDIFRLLPSALKKRRHIQKHRSVPNSRITALFHPSAPRLHVTHVDTPQKPAW